MSETRAVQRPVNGGAAARREQRRLQTEAQQQARRRAETAAQRRRWLIWGAIIGGSILALGLLIYWLVRPEPGPQAQILPIQGRTHIARGATHPAYNSTPPTSGWHYADAVAPPGISAQRIPDEVQVHNLEHGEIMIQYNCPEGCPEIVSALEAIVRTYPKKVVMAPYPGFDAKIALTSWGRLVYLNEVDEAFIRRYIASNKDKGPEVFPD